MILTYLPDRDPEAENEEKVEEEKLPGVEEEGPAAIESGFQQAGGDWDAPAPGLPAQSSNWDGAAPNGANAVDDWAASGAPATEWSNEAAKETQW